MVYKWSMSKKLQPERLAQYIYVVDRLEYLTTVEASLRSQILQTYPKGTHEVESSGGVIVVSVETNYSGDLSCFVNYKDEIEGGNV